MEGENTVLRDHDNTVLEIDSQSAEEPRDCLRPIPGNDESNVNMVLKLKQPEMTADEILDSMLPMPFSSLDQTADVGHSSMIHKTNVDQTAEIGKDILIPEADLA